MAHSEFTRFDRYALPAPVGLGILVVLMLVLCGASGCSEDISPEQPVESVPARDEVIPGRSAVAQLAREARRKEIAEINDDVVVLTEELLSAIRRDDMQAIMATMANHELLVNAPELASTDFPDPTEVRELLKQRVQTLPDAINEAQTRLKHVFEKAGIDWATVEIKSITPHDIRFADSDEPPVNSFRGVYVVFEDTALPGQEFVLKLGGGVRLNGRWWFAKSWEPVERLD